MVTKLCDLHQHDKTHDVTMNSMHGDKKSEKKVHVKLYNVCVYI